MEKLSDDEISLIVSFLDLKSFVQFGETNRWHFELCRVSIAWKYLCKDILSGFSPFDHLEGAPFKQKLRYWVARESRADLTLVGSCRIFRPRYIHRACRRRCPLTGLFESYIFGGNYLDNSNVENKLDLWRVSVTEAIAEIAFVPQQLEMSNFHPASASMTRTSHSCSASAIASLQGLLYVFGGMDTSRNFSCQLLRFQKAPERADTWRVDDLTPAERAPSNWPPPRWGHTLVNAYDDFLVLFGGSSPLTSHGDLWIFSADQGWIEVRVPEGWPKPRGRSGHGAAVVGDYMYVIGGNDIRRNFNDMWVLNLVTLFDMRRSRDSFQIGDDSSALWRCLSIDCSKDEGPSARIGHTCSAVGSTLVVYGGRDFHRQTFHPGVCMFDTVSRRWSRCQRPDRRNPYDEEEPLVRTGHCAIPASSGLLFVGGLAPADRVTSDVLHLNLFGVFPGSQHCAADDFCEEATYHIKEIEN